MQAPNHVAIIMDGNGRWAKSKGFPRTVGHAKGAQNLEDMLYIADELGIKYLTVYAFSTENWKRSEDEVMALMNLFRQYLRNGFKKAARNNVRIRVIGYRPGLPQDLQELADEIEEFSKDNTGLQFTIALNYGSRDELIRMMQSAAREVAAGNLKPEEIDEEYISSHLDTKDLPDPDLLIRTSGEQRVSNYLLWQLAYTEFYYTDVHWPVFGKAELQKAIEWYNTRDRRYGNAK
ncbi:MAG: isoprenyl transferase [Lachnospiraceae bacterium]|jgi:undecaprenyl diphosphate synthase|nr:isoprenyl transferase [Lachnospiraceae bacterium]MBQ6637853.1 isoprenyl transferase [Lachnospiraceae bacterium]